MATESFFYFKNVDGKLIVNVKYPGNDSATELRPKTVHEANNLFDEFIRPDIRKSELVSRIDETKTRIAFLEEENEKFKKIKKIKQIKDLSKVGISATDIFCSFPRALINKDNRYIYNNIDVALKFYGAYELLNYMIDFTFNKRFESKAYRMQEDCYGLTGAEFRKKISFKEFESFIKGLIMHHSYDFDMSDNIHFAKSELNSYKRELAELSRPRR